MNWSKSSLVKDKRPKVVRHLLEQKVEHHTLDMLMKDLKLLVEHMDSIKTLNHTFLKPISTNIGINPTNDWRGI